MGRTLTNVVELVVQPICTLYIWQINMFKPVTKRPKDQKKIVTKQIRYKTNIIQNGGQSRTHTIMVRFSRLFSAYWILQMFKLVCTITIEIDFFCHIKIFVMCIYLLNRLRIPSNQNIFIMIIETGAGRSVPLPKCTTV